MNAAKYSKGREVGVRVVSMGSPFQKNYIIKYRITELATIHCDGGGRGGGGGGGGDEVVLQQSLLSSPSPSSSSSSTLL